jgi:hypothetical protein
METLGLIGPISVRRPWLISLEALFLKSSLITWGSWAELCFQSILGRAQECIGIKMGTWGNLGRPIQPNRTVLLCVHSWVSTALEKEFFLWKEPFRSYCVVHDKPPLWIMGKYNEQSFKMIDWEKCVRQNRQWVNIVYPMNGWMNEWMKWGKKVCKELWFQGLSQRPESIDTQVPNIKWCGVCV